jgi:transposase
VQRWNAGCRNALALWRDLRDNHGYPHSPRTVARLVEVLRRDSGTARTFRSVAAQSIYAVDEEQRRPLTARQAQRLWLSRPGQRSAWLETYCRALCTRDAGLAHAYLLTQHFCMMVRERTGEKLDDWLAETSASGIAQLVNFAKGLRRDYAAVKAGLTVEWSNGQTEAQIHRLKLLKRAMVRRVTHDDIAPTRSLDKEDYLGVIGITLRRKATGKAAFQKSGHGTETMRAIGP